MCVGPQFRLAIRILFVTKKSSSHLEILLAKMGRPEVDTEPVTIRMHRDMIKQIDNYRRTLEELPSRPEVIRRVMADFLAQVEEKKED